MLFYVAELTQIHSHILIYLQVPMSNNSVYVLILYFESLRVLLGKKCKKKKKISIHLHTVNKWLVQLASFKMYSKTQRSLRLAKALVLMLLLCIIFSNNTTAFITNYWQQLKWKVLNIAMSFLVFGRSSFVRLGLAWTLQFCAKPHDSL